MTSHIVGLALGMSIMALVIAWYLLARSYWRDRHPPVCSGRCDTSIALRTERDAMRAMLDLQVQAGRMLQREIAILKANIASLQQAAMQQQIAII